MVGAIDSEGLHDALGGEADSEKVLKASNIIVTLLSDQALGVIRAAA